MDEANIDILTGRIRRSTLLSPDRAEALLAVLPTLDDAQAEALSAVIEGENGFLEELGQRVVTDAVARGDDATLARIDEIIGGGAKTMRAGEEHAERSDEQSKADHLFDDAA